ncbi:hypothetical protein ITP53_16780 [Nonomuraea sp. K274]|uniref:Uncharacterized protein n=1 Tax=Nonomuraea cypriaca TaxID=1187855 RepID=A0A931F1D8_9ACTN|nr:hypothetical protein [Nonomuraea cypriaca]MBF8187358.1 hypothetical protein [Nonomuraea cypriaca]
MTEWADPATIRERQTAAVTVLMTLLALDLPTPDWHIGTVYLASADRLPELEGQLSGPHYETPETAQAAIDAWAAHFDATPNRRENTSPFLRVKAVIDGVQVCVWGNVPVTKKTRKLAAVAA